MPDYVFQSTLLPLAAYTSSGTGVGPTATLSQVVRGANVQLIVTQAASSAGATLDVYVQSAPQVDPSSSGSNWDDFVHFNQVTTTAGTQAAQWVREIQPSSSGGGLIQGLGVHSQITASLAAGSVRQGPIGPLWRTNYVVTGNPVTPFKFAVVASIQP